MDVMKLCKKKDGFYEVDPAIMFPAMIERIKAVRSGEKPKEVGAAFLKEFVNVKDEALDLALQPRDEVKEPLLIALRAEALGFAENYFSRALSKTVKKGVRVHILKNQDYRR